MRRVLYEPFFIILRKVNMKEDKIINSVFKGGTQVGPFFISEEMLATSKGEIWQILKGHLSPDNNGNSAEVYIIYFVDKRYGFIIPDNVVKKFLDENKDGHNERFAK